MPTQNQYFSLQSRLRAQPRSDDQQKLDRESEHRAFQQHTQSASSPRIEFSVTTTLFLSLQPKPASADTPGDGQVRAVIIDADDEEQLLSSFEKRESTVQPLRARVSWLYGRRLKQQGEASGGIVISLYVNSRRCK